MVPTLTIIGIAAALVVGGTVVSLFLYTRCLSEARHSRFVRRRLDVAAMRHATEYPFPANVSAIDGELTHYARRAVVALIFALVMLALIVLSMVHAFLH
jgi:hypothetical protein